VIVLPDAVPASRRAVYLAFPAFRQYAEMGQAYLREIILHGLRRLLPDPVLTSTLPVQGVHTPTVQPPRRHIVHLLHASPVKRGNREVIEDLVELRDVEVVLRLPRRPARVYLAPGEDALPFSYAGGRLRVRVPVVAGHGMVAVEGAGPGRAAEVMRRGRRRGPTAGARPWDRGS
jgi:hypothetical protein